MSGFPGDGPAATLAGGYVRSAVQDGGEYPDFYLDPIAFDRLGDASGAAAASLRDIAARLRTTRTRPEIPALSMPDPDLQSVMDGINRLCGMIDGAVSAAAGCAELVEECADSLEAVRLYFQDTAGQFRAAEQAAVSFLETWEQEWGT